MPESAPTRLPLFAQPDNRGYSSSVDAKLVNVVGEKVASGDLALGKRPGLKVQFTYSSGTPRGIYIRLSGIQTLYWVIGNQLYTTGVPNPISLGAVDDYGYYWFDGTLGSPGYTYLSNGRKGYYFD